MQGTKARRRTTARPPTALAPLQSAPLTLADLETMADMLRTALQTQCPGVDLAAFDGYLAALRDKMRPAALPQPVAVALVEAAAIVNNRLAPVTATLPFEYAALPVEDEDDTVTDEQLAPFASFADKHWSRFQQRIFFHVARERGNAIVNAVAGSGKTTTIVAAARFITVPALFCAFNTHIKAELEDRLRGTSMTVKTIHSIGLSALTAYAQTHGLRLGKADEYKYRLPIDRAFTALVHRLHITRDETRRVAEETFRALAERYVRVNLVDPRDSVALGELADKYGLMLLPEWEAPMGEAIAAVLDEGRKSFEQRGAFDFTDMLWLPCVMDLPMPYRYGYVLVDEAQDLNRAQQEIVAKSMLEGARLLAVGDPRQAIYAFAGADAESYDRMKARFGCREFPLSINYRCHQGAIRLAQRYVPHLTARPDAPEGIVASIAEADLTNLEHAAHLQEGDLVLCRLTAPLVALCMNLIAKRIPAKVRGRDVGKQIADLVAEVEKFYLSVNPMDLRMPWEAFGGALESYRRTMIGKLSSRKDAEQAIQTLEDKCDALRVVYDNYHAESAQELIAQINGLFYDETKKAEKPAVALSTVHKAKGLEERRVFIFRPGKLPLDHPRMTEQQKAQEENLVYVALTRPKEALYYIQEA